MGRLRQTFRDVVCRVKVVLLIAVQCYAAAAPSYVRGLPEPTSQVVQAAGDCVPVTDFGALGDGVHDDTAAFVAAVAAVASTAGCVRVPAVKLGAGYVLTGTVSLPGGVQIIGSLAGTPSPPWAFGAPGDFNTTGGSRILARPTVQKQPRRQPSRSGPAAAAVGPTAGAPLFTLTAGCVVRGLEVIYDRMPFPTDDEILGDSNATSPWHYASFAEAHAGFLRDHVYSLGVGPTFYITEGRRVYVTDVIGAGFVDFIYFAGGGHGQSTIRNAHGWGYGRFVSVEQAEDVMSFQNLRFIINAAGRVLGPRPGPGVCGPGASGAGTERCRGNFTVLPALVALNPGNVGLWLGRADGYSAADVFFFGVNTGVRLGYAHGSAWTAMVDPVTGVEAQALAPATGPWGSFSQLMVDQCQVGVHVVWPNPLTNRFSSVQLHPSFWDSTLTFPSANATGSGNVSDVGVGLEAAFLFDATHTIANNAGMVPTTMVQQLVVASFNDSTNFGPAASMLGESNGRAFVFAGDGGNVDCIGFAMNNEMDGHAQLWGASGAQRRVSLRIRSAIVNYALCDDIFVSQPTAK